ncbi:DeoR/GlpR family DNA-binding transcription regulator [Arsenicicoccus piscis]|uniref:Lactose phosphotransferase system repressor n=1 Tax=Arsenicicoccus piscis TaxID=673954 RepID=A0ABQ6HLX8_9MICO|nr:DeoR/GlpR family DNA-binding transcription regulator [Arsenicicoccus piscis]MCH8628596.1 DeoR/GlpR family DNA-binding transcription regulator [Arsenicicoccus piscis]GMA19483.1 DeoR family transcriptional regulator [Arsenicicoccus piscis]
MYQHERHQLIVERARTEGRLEVSALAEELDVTPETIRRDLTILERHGHLRRVHGGAIPIERLGFEPTTAARAERHTAEKARIGARAAELIPADAAILLDAGTTTAALVEHLPRGGELTVVTNSVTVAATISDRDDINLYLLGGRLRARTLASVGSWAVDALQDVHVDVAFVGTNGLDVHAGLTTPDQSEANTKRAMVAAARRVVVVADHSKVGQTHFARFARLSQIDTVVTDSGLDAETAHEIASHGPEVVTA